jgi:homoserine kinase type II
MEIICKSCPNGCLLRLDRKDDRTILVRGHGCAKGVAYAHSTARHTMPGHYEAAVHDNDFGKADLERAASLWGKRIVTVRFGAFIQGSPERSGFRAVVIDEQEISWVLEMARDDDVDKKRLIASRVRLLHEKGLPVIEYERGLNGEEVQREGERHWLLSRFVKGVQLDRKTYWRDGQRGKALADFLADLYAHTRGDEWLTGTPFSLPSYIESLLDTMRRSRQEVFGDFGGIVEHLRKELFPVHDSVPQRFCHGDPHPMNILWGDQGIKAVIDWEFCGLRPVLYDAALVIGCVGSESPDALDAGFIQCFCQRLVERKAFTAAQWDLLPLFVIAQRFAWLSEWLRRNDEEMIQFESGFIDFLLRNTHQPIHQHLRGAASHEP